MSLSKIVWKITLEGSEEGESDDLELIFTDTSNILGEPVISREFLDSIIDLTKTHEHYSIFRNLKKIISDKGEDMTGSAIWALLGIVKQNSQRIGLLLGSLTDGGVHIIGSWPETFTDQLRTDTSLVDIVLNNFINTQKFWEQVDLIIGFH
ncbi:MAG: hypothetical protein INQ03_08525 [Candidatus Heimdallarchaeota archaeon]|nr:hypothetical protein [Candidatus Heimdallarchaeota archaeon]